MNIDKKTIGNLLDELTVTNLRCWFAQDDIMNPSLSDGERLDAAVRAQEANKKRNALIRAIDKRLGEGKFTVAEKKYG